MSKDLTFSDLDLMRFYCKNLKKEEQDKFLLSFCNNNKISVCGKIKKDDKKDEPKKKSIKKNKIEIQTKVKNTRINKITNRYVKYLELIADTTFLLTELDSAITIIEQNWLSKRVPFVKVITIYFREQINLFVKENFESDNLQEFAAQVNEDYLELEEILEQEKSEEE